MLRVRRWRPGRGSPQSDRRRFSSSEGGGDGGRRSHRKPAVCSEDRRCKCKRHSSLSMNQVFLFVPPPLLLRERGGPTVSPKCFLLPSVGLYADGGSYCSRVRGARAPQGTGRTSCCCATPATRGTAHGPEGARPAAPEPGQGGGVCTTLGPRHTRPLRSPNAPLPLPRLPSLWLG